MEERVAQDIKLLEDRATGLRQSLTNLRLTKEKFIKAQGMDEQIEKLRADAETFRSEARISKGAYADLVAKKNKTISGAMTVLMGKMNAILPAGKAKFTVSEDGEVFIGWVRPDERVVPYHGLSGGEKQPFDNALAHAIGANILIGEYAELDPERFAVALEKISADTGMQAIISSCHDPVRIPDGWEVVRL